MALDYLAVFIATLFFAFLTIAHLVRIFRPFTIAVAGHQLPHWASYIFVIVGGYVTLFLYLFL